MAEDAEARKMAALAQKQIETHEDYCGERWASTNKAIDELRNDVKEVHSRINGLARTVVRSAFWVLLGIAGFALVQWLLARGVAG